MSECGNWTDPGVPNTGWVCESITDLGQPAEMCEMCQKEEIRYVHTMRHPEYGLRIDAGCVCAAKMARPTENAPITDEAQSRERVMKNIARRRVGWLTHSGWKVSRKGNDFIKTKEGYLVTIFRNARGWGASVRHEPSALDRASQRTYGSSDEAKMAAFEVISDALRRAAVR